MLPYRFLINDVPASTLDNFHSISHFMIKRLTNIPHYDTTLVVIHFQIWFTQSAPSKEWDGNLFIGRLS